VLLAVAYAQVPPGCQAPALFTADLFAVDTERGGVQIQARYYYDYFLQRKARREVVNANSTQTFYQVIELWQYDGGVYYEINQQTQACVKGKLNGPFVPHGVFPNSTFQGNYVIGSSSQPGSGLLIEAWATNFTSPQGNIQWFATFSQFDCFPIRDQYIFPGNQPQFFIEEFFNGVNGITDPNAFVPPPQCPP